MKTAQYLIQTFYPGCFDKVFSFEDFEKTDFSKVKKRLEYLLMNSNDVDYWGDTESDKQLATFLKARFHNINTFKKDLEM
ncbi:hypothetical protein E3O82_002514 [Enterococcus faecalis]|nr:hypothetical protein [Enterococcus faecalis]